MMITIINKNIAEDYSVDEDMTIISVLKIIQSNTSREFGLDSLNYIKSFRRDEMISVFKTLTEANIYNGDILIVEEDGRE